MAEHMQPRGLAGQVALVTGGGRGLGRAYAQALADAGATVAVAARSMDQLEETVRVIRQHGGRAIAQPVDVSSGAAIVSMVAEVQRQLGPMDLLVNSAGTPGPAGPFAETDPDEWWRVQEVNVRGPMLCTRAVLPGMLARRRGRIINVSSAAGNQPFPLLSAYAVSKSALTRFTENVAVETQQQGVYVFAISPGVVRTAMSEWAAHQTDSPAVAQRFQQWFAEGTDVPAELSARLVVRLALGDADVLSGRLLSIRDDLDELVARSEEIAHDALHTLRLRT